MADPFDPYLEWLGVPSADGPPDHYRLLGLQTFESDPERITKKADALMARVRRIRPGDHLTEWSAVLDHLASAKACLLDPSGKQAYDAVLSQPKAPQPKQSAASAPPCEPPSQTKRDESVFDLIAEAVELTRGPSTAPSPVAAKPAQDAAPPAPSETRHTNPAKFGLKAVFLAVAAIGVVGLLAYARSHGGAAAEKPSAASSAPAIAEPAARPSVPSEPPAPPPVVVHSAPSTSPSGSPKIEPPPAPPAENASEEIDATMAAAFGHAVANVRALLAQRDLEGAAEQLDVASTNAQTTEDRGQIDRLRTMTEYLGQFWEAIRDSMAKLRAAEELVFKDRRAIVIESSRDEIKVKTEGRIHRFHVATLPNWLVMRFVQQRFGTDPGSKAIIGTFLAVDPRGDRALARQYFREAAQAGFDSEKLLPELDAVRTAR